MHKRKITIFLATMLALVACGSNGLTPSRGSRISVNTSRDHGQSTQISADTSEQQKTSDQVSDSKQESQSSSSEKQSSSNQEQSSSSSQSSSSENQSSSSQQQSSSSSQSSSSENQSSSSQQQSSSSSEQQGDSFEYDKNLLKHAEGKTVEYILEAECTNLGGKEGLGYSGTASESNMAVHDMAGNGYVTYLYKMGLSINFIIVCDSDINDGVLSARFGGEFMDVLLNPSNYSFRVDTIVTNEDLNEAKGNWDAAFLEYYTDLSQTGGYFVEQWDCGEIHIDATGLNDPGLFETFKITSTLRLKKGVNCISLITDNDTSPGMGTMAAIAPVVDYISISTSANLGMLDINDNGEGTTGIHIKA